MLIKKCRLPETFCNWVSEPQKSLFKDVSCNRIKKKHLKRKENILFQNCVPCTCLSPVLVHTFFSGGNLRRGAIRTLKIDFCGSKIQLQKVSNN